MNKALKQKLKDKHAKIHLKPVIILQQFFQMTRQSIIFPKRRFFFPIQTHTLKDKVSKTKYSNVYFVVRGNTQFTVFSFCLGKAQNPMLFYFSSLYLPDLENLAKSDRTICQRAAFVYLRQCVIDVFCSTSTERSRKSSSLLLTCCKKIYM